MQNESPLNDPQQIWQTQNTELIKMSQAYFRQKAEQQRSNARWRAVANDSTFVAAAGFLAFSHAQSTTSRAGVVLLALGLLQTAIQGHRRLWPSSATVDATPLNGLEAYRRELEKKINHSRDIWWTLLPLVPGLLCFVPAIADIVQFLFRKPSFLVNALPFTVLLAIWLVLMLPVRRRRLRRLREELKALDDMARNQPTSSL